MDNQTINDIRNQLMARKVSAVELVQEFLKRANEKSGLNAFITLHPENCLQQAKNIDEKINKGVDLPLLGAIIPVKDNINTNFLPTSVGTGALKNNVPVKNALVIDHLLNAGAIIAGKTNLHELSFGITTNNSSMGACHNPHNPAMIPGGSSGGSAAAVASGIVNAAMGTDTGGSVRLPASLCGIIGFRPTTNRYSNKGLAPISHTRDTAGAICRYFDDIIAIDAVLSQNNNTVPAIGLKDLRLLVPNNYYWENCDDEVYNQCQGFLQQMERAGVTLVHDSIEDLANLNNAVSFPIALYEFMLNFPKYLSENAPNITMEDVRDKAQSPDVKGLVAHLMGEGAMPKAVYDDAMNIHRPHLSQNLQRALQSNRCHAMIYPTSAYIARPIGDDETIEFKGTRIPTFASFIRNLDPASNTDMPSISLPVGLGKTSNLPIGITLDSIKGDDNQLLQIAKTIYQICH